MHGVIYFPGHSCYKYLCCNEWEQTKLTEYFDAVRSVNMLMKNCTFYRIRMILRILLFKNKMAGIRFLLNSHFGIDDPHRIDMNSASAFTVVKIWIAT